MAVPLWFLEEERRQVFRQRKVLDQLSDYEIRKNFGLPWWGAQAICEFFQPLEGQKISSIPLETKALAFISYLRSGNFQYSLGTLSGISQSSVSRIIDNFSNYTVSLAKDHIKFSSLLEERVANKLGFYELSQKKLGGILGVVDGTHVNIIAPRIDEFAYVNRKLQHSINCQVVVNYDYLITDAVVKWPGSAHDSFIWNQSSVRTRLKNGEFGEGYFLGDSGYPLEPWLLTPYPDSSQEDFKKTYNNIFKRTRSVVERGIGNWKSRFRSMCKTGGVSCYNEGKVCKLILSSIVLHNFCVKKEIPLTEDDKTFRDTTVIPYYENHPFDNLSAARVSAIAQATRNRIAQQL